jgi:hypothetical protein
MAPDDLRRQETTPVSKIGKEIFESTDVQIKRSALSATRPAGRPVR